MPTTPTADPPPVFAGSLSVESTRGSPPVLILTIQCGRCRRQHYHRWSVDEAGAESWTAQLRHPHCRDAAPDADPYLVAPTPTPHNRTVYARYTTAVAEREARAARRAAAPPVA